VPLVPWPGDGVPDTAVPTAAPRVERLAGPSAAAAAPHRLPLRRAHPLRHAPLRVGGFGATPPAAFQLPSSQASGWMGERGLSAFAFQWHPRACPAAACGVHSSLASPQAPRHAHRLAPFALADDIQR
jgi:hypothetical protein